MPTLTAIILSGFVAYAIGWYSGRIEGSFALLLFLASAVSGVYWLAEQWFYLPRRRAAVLQLDAQHAKRIVDLKAQGITVADNEAEFHRSREEILRQPWWMDWTAGLFPVIAAVFFLRSFLFEPFKIPSGSMIPTLHVGDLILVNKFHYGIRLPVINHQLTSGTPVKRGDVMVFRYPPKPSLDYIKRVVGVPGDKIAYLNKRLTINGQPVSKVSIPEFFDADNMRYSKQFEENLPIGSTPADMSTRRIIRLLNEEAAPNFVSGIEDFAYKENCTYSVEGLECTVPAGHYFMMGDNRDNSLDSRYWGFVPDKNIVGKAFFVWMNFSNPSRIGSFD
ncbi:MAG: signal peptidase I [Burkholderiaceae bacterium]|jgi:signal peptidase I|nr:signal peptidase I [Burkholderiaceae bacterium]